MAIFYSSGILKLLSREYGTFEFRIRSEFYGSNDVIVGHISLPHQREKVKSMFI